MSMFSNSAVGRKFGIEPVPFREWPEYPWRITVYTGDGWGARRLATVTIDRLTDKVSFDPPAAGSMSMLRIAHHPLGSKRPVDPLDGPLFMAGLAVSLGWLTHVKVALEY